MVSLCRCGIQTVALVKNYLKLGVHALVSEDQQVEHECWLVSEESLKCGYKVLHERTSDGALLECNEP